ncbi:hypothetical protein H5410_056278 [Solanum commersonii]|uniref:Uncharacterized protein n=1 Tax=Solanum commersonii TaxID=4109 RepID=A0A9J5WMA1_SOLCO|nr:hypothetical protein H5410_056278 [Solanum commersonii]
MTIKSLAQMREGVRNEEGSSFIDDLLGDSEPVFDQTPEVRVAPSTDSSDTDEDNIPLKWAVQRRMVLVTTKGKEKVTEETQKRKSFTRETSQKLMGDAIKLSEINIAYNRRRRRSKEVVIEFPTEDVVEVSNELSKNEFVDDDITAQKRTGKRGKNKEKSKSRTSQVKKDDTTAKGKGKGKEPQRKKEPSKRKKESSHVLKHKSEQDPVLGGRVSDPEIITKPGMDFLADLVEIQ